MNNYRLMFIDGTVEWCIAPTKTIALNDIFKRKVDEYETYDDFFYDINFVEWKDNSKRYLQNLITRTMEVFPVNSRYNLINFTPTPEPVEELRLEFEENYENF